MSSIDYHLLPESSGGFSKLFTDYIRNFEAVSRFYAFDYRMDESFRGAMENIRRRNLARADVCNVLEAQNRSFGCSASTLANIEKLRHDNSYAIVTGQQVGLFGGPLYTLLKTITAIKLAHRLQNSIPGSYFVPVFWLEGEDHDFEEMNNISVLDPQYQLTRVEYLPGGELPERMVRPVGDIVFDASLQQTHEAITRALGVTEFTDELIQQLRANYLEQKTFNQAFASWLSHLFEDFGLVFLSPNHTGLKRIVSPAFVQEVETFPGTSQTVIAESAELESRYHAQIKPKSLNLFLFHKEGRYLVEPRETDFSLKGTRHFLSKDQLLEIAREHPEQLSPNVVLRPIIQDLLLPTVAYVGGPSEIAYMAQLRRVYEQFGLCQPVVYPRASVSFVLERTERVIEKYGVTIETLFEGSGAATATALANIADVKVERLFEDATRRIHQSVQELQFGLKEIDQTLLPPFEGVMQKIEHNLSVLKEKSLAAQKRRNETLVNQIDRAVQTLLPGGLLQDRALSPLYFMNKYGLDLVPWLYNEVDITLFKHQILTL